jgi:GNAT superfamily N-acetyltransferase
VKIEIDPRPVDWPAVHALVCESYAYMDGRIDPASSVHTMSAVDFARKAADESVVVATLGELPVGCLFVASLGSWLYVSKMAVSPLHQGRGIGRALMEIARRVAHDRGLLGLELATRIELVENHATFAKLGFVKVAEESHPGFDRVTSIRMRAPLVDRREL